jgi:hypothetical protein
MTDTVASTSLALLVPASPKRDACISHQVRRALVPFSPALLSLRPADLAFPTSPVALSCAFKPPSPVVDLPPEEEHEQLQRNLGSCSSSNGNNTSGL